MGNVETSLVRGKIHRNFPKSQMVLRGTIKKADFKHERMFGRVAKIPTANTFDELIEIDFVEYGEFAKFLRAHVTFSRFSVIIFTGAIKKEEKTAEMVRGEVISNWLEVFGAP